jgi:hypothetical protein
MRQRSLALNQNPISASQMAEIISMGHWCLVWAFQILIDDLKINRCAQIGKLKLTNIKANNF